MSYRGSPFFKLEHSSPPVVFPSTTLGAKVYRILLFTIALPYALRAITVMVHLYQFYQLKLAIKEISPKKRVTSITGQPLGDEEDREEFDELLDKTALAIPRQDYEAMLSGTLGRVAFNLQPYMSSEADMLPMTVEQALVAEKRLASTERVEQETPASWLYIRAFEEERKVKRPTVTVKEPPPRIPDGPGPETKQNGYLKHFVKERTEKAHRNQRHK